ncbi:MAG: DNA polymerase III subunit delta [Verrucomicrobiota bacterium]
MSAKPFTFICGNDDYLVSERGKAWFSQQAADLTDDLSKEIVDGRAGNVAEVEAAISRFTSAIQTLSLFGERKVVWLKDVNFLADSQTGRAQGTIDLLEHLKETLGGLDPAAVGVLITAQPVDKRRSFFKWCEKTADFEGIGGSKDAIQGLVEIVQNECSNAGVKIAHDAIQLLIAKVNANTRLVVEETRKLITFVASSEDLIDERLVTDLVPNFGEADFFEAADAFYSLRLDWTLDALKRHFFTNSEARPLLGSLQSRNRLLIQLRVLLDANAIRLGGRGISKSELATAAQTYGKHFGDNPEKSNLNVFSQNPWYLGRLAETASKLSLKKLVDFQIAFAEAFEGILQRPNTQEEVCRELAIKCLS